MKKLSGLIKTYNDFPKKGIAFKDLLGIIQDSEVFRELIQKMSRTICLIGLIFSFLPGVSLLGHLSGFIAGCFLFLI